MRTPPMDRAFARRLDRRGIALPVALVGLVAISLMVTTALLTSSSESAIAVAQSSGLRSLYSAEASLQGHVFNQISLGAAFQVGEQTVTGSDGRHVRLTTAHLGTYPAAANFTESVYSITAQPMRGNRESGRAVVAMIRQRTPPPQPLSTNITSAITVNGNLAVKGNAFTVSGYDACTEAGHEKQDAQAVRGSEDTQIIPNSEKHMDNFIGVGTDGKDAKGDKAIEITDLSRAELERNVLGGVTLEELVASVPAQYKWGPSRPWGGFLDKAIGLAVVDANGGYVEVTGGEGTLIIYNGDLRMRGNSRFKGIIIVEGNFNLAGTPTVEGALIALDRGGTNEIDLDDSAIGAGHVTVKYNLCEIRRAQEAFGAAAGNQPPAVQGRTFAWFEVIR